MRQELKRRQRIVRALEALLPSLRDLDNPIWLQMDEWEHSCGDGKDDTLESGLAAVLLGEEIQTPHGVYVPADVRGGLLELGRSLHPDCSEDMAAGDLLRHALCALRELVRLRFREDRAGLMAWLCSIEHDQRPVWEGLDGGTPAWQMLDLGESLDDALGQVSEAIEIETGRSGRDCVGGGEILTALVRAPETADQARRMVDDARRELRRRFNEARAKTKAPAGV